MNIETTNSVEVKPKPPNAIDILTNTMVEFREEMEFFNNTGSKIAARTRRILRFGFTAFIISTVILVIMIVQMSDYMSKMTTHLEDMYHNFGSMSQEMKEITKTVDLMESDTAGVPQIAASMIQIDVDVDSMSSSTRGMNQSIASMDYDISTINSNTHEMTGRLSNMKYSVNSMSHNINEMLSPVNGRQKHRPWSR